MKYIVGGSVKTSWNRASRAFFDSLRSFSSTMSERVLMSNPRSAISSIHTERAIAIGAMTRM